MPSPPADPPRPASVTVAPTSIEFEALTDTVRLTAEIRDQNGQVMSGVRVVWTSDLTGVATVSAAGTVTAVGNGTATITAAAGNASGQAIATVAQQPAAVTVTPASLSFVSVGDTARLAATVVDANDHVIDGVAVSWSTSDAAVATVDGMGLVHARSVGAAVVSAEREDMRGLAWVSVSSTNPGDHQAALIAGVPEHPFRNATVGGQEGSARTVGTLRMGLNPDLFPVIVSEGDMGPSVLVAGSSLGSGRVVAFSGQDFLGSNDRATLVGHEHVSRVLANTVRWTADDSRLPLRVLVDNRRVADALEAHGLKAVEVVGSGPGGEDRDWNANSLNDVDVAVVQVNEWGTAHLVGESLAPLRAFVERGGGLVIAGSALHWSWWVERHHGPFAGNVLLRGTGISWNEDSISEIESATTKIDLQALTPAIAWTEYLSGQPLDATRMSLLPPLFSAALELGRLEELDAALVRLARETPPLPVSADAPEARLAAAVASSLGAYEWPEIHPWATAFPGLPSSGARRVDGSVVVDATGSEFPGDARRRERQIPLGFYAPPGGRVTVSVPSSVATTDLRIAVGWDHNDLRPLRDRHPEWRRPPALRRTFEVTATETAVTNAYGGSLALVVPESYRGMVPVTIDGAIPMAVYTAGASSAGEWFADLDAGAPQAIIQEPGGIRFVISTENARGVDDPGEISAFWAGFQRHHAELAGEPVPRGYESIWIFDPQVGHGYANTEELTINYPLHAEHWAMVPGTTDGRAWIATLPTEGPGSFVSPPPAVYSPRAHGVDWWLFGHELGHQWQTGDWGSPWEGGIYPEIGEVAVNLFTMYTENHYLFGGTDSTIIATHDCAPSDVDHAALANLRWPAADTCERLALYRQLIDEFGWDSIKRVFHGYYDPALPRSTYGGGLDGFAIRLSAVVQRDLVGFFRRWEYPLSSSGEVTIRAFGFEAWLPPGW